MLNHIVIMGRLTRDPELRTTQSGVNLAAFTVAVDRDYSGQGQEKQTDFIDCVAWRQAGEFVSKHFRKGSMIVVSGRLQSNKWNDRDGNNRVSWTVNADSVYFGESKKNADTGGNATAQDSNYAYQGQYGAAPQQNYQRGTAPDPNVTPPDARAAYAGVQTQFTELDDDDGDLPF